MWGNQFDITTYANFIQNGGFNPLHNFYPILLVTFAALNDNDYCGFPIELAQTGHARGRSCPNA